MKKIVAIILCLICLSGCGNNALNEFTKKIEEILIENNVENFEIINTVSKAGKFDSVTIEVNSNTFDELSSEQMFDIIKKIADEENERNLFTEEDMLVSLKYKSEKNTYDRIIATDNKILTINERIVYYKKGEKHKLTKSELLGVWNSVKTGNLYKQTESSLEDHTFAFFETYPTFVYINPNDEDYNGVWWIEDNKLFIQSADKSMSMDAVECLGDMYWFFDDGSYIILDKS